MNTQNSNTPAKFRIKSAEDILTLPVTEALRDLIAQLLQKALRRARTAKVDLESVEQAVESIGYRFITSEGRAAAVQVSSSPHSNPLDELVALLSGDGINAYEFEVCGESHIHIVWDVTINPDGLSAHPVLDGNMQMGNSSNFAMSAIMDYLGYYPTYDHGISSTPLPFHPTLKWALTAEVDGIMAEIVPEFAQQANIFVLKPEAAERVLALMGIDVDDVEEVDVAANLLTQYAAMK